MYLVSAPAGLPQATPARPLQGGRAFRWPAFAGLPVALLLPLQEAGQAAELAAAPEKPQALLGGLGGNLDRGYAPQARQGNLQDLRQDLTAAEAIQASPEDRAAALRAVRLVEAAREAEKASNAHLRRLGLPCSPLTTASPVDRAILAQDARVQAAEARLLAALQSAEKAPSRATRAQEDLASCNWAQAALWAPEASPRMLREAAHQALVAAYQAWGQARLALKQALYGPVSGRAAAQARAQAAEAQARECEAAGLAFVARGKAARAEKPRNKRGGRR